LIILSLQAAVAVDTPMVLEVAAVLVVIGLVHRYQLQPEQLTQ
jgi:hypothetical protein